MGIVLIILLTSSIVSPSAVSLAVTVLILSKVGRNVWLAVFLSQVIAQKTNSKLHLLHSHGGGWEWVWAPKCLPTEHLPADNKANVFSQEELASPSQRVLHGQFQQALFSVY